MTNNLIKLSFNWNTPWVRIWSIMALILSLFACVDKKNPAESSGYGFSGVARLETLEGGRWRIIWEPITAVTNARYLVYQKSQNAKWDLNLPVARTKDHFIVTDDLRFLNSQCFLVRALVDDQAFESNNKEECTGHTAFQFEGISSITPLDADGYVLNWRAEGFSGRELIYEVRRREKNLQNWILLASTATNYFLEKDSPATPLDTSKNYCYKVNFLHEKYKDNNTKELCSDSAIQFDGVSTATFLPPASADITWTVAASEIGKIDKFRVYRLQGRAERVLLAEILNDRREGKQDFTYKLKGITLEARFEVLVKAVSKNVGLEDPNNKSIDLYSKNVAPRVLVFNPTTPGCEAIDALENAGKDAKAMLGVIDYKAASERCFVDISATTKLDGSNRVVPDKVTCTARFTDPDLIQKRLRPRFIFRARLPGSERPVVTRVTDAKGFVDVNPGAAYTEASSTYTIDPSVDKRGSDIFCEVVVSDTIQDSITYSSAAVILPDTAPTSTGMFISKKLKYLNATLGSTHYYSDPDGGPGTPGHTCLRPKPNSTDFEPNTSANDVCEDSVLDILIKPAKIPENLLTPGNETAFQSFLAQIDFQKKGLGINYSDFYPKSSSTTDPDYNNLFRLGYVDPDPGDKATNIEMRNPRNARLPGCGTDFNSTQTHEAPDTSKTCKLTCLEGSCLVNLRLNKDYNSGLIYGEKDGNSVVLPHAEFEYRVRTSKPSTELGNDIFGQPNSEVGWTKWAKVQVEVTAVDEEPVASGSFYTGTEDRIQKVVLCEDQSTDPECAVGKSLNLETDPIAIGLGAKYISNFGKGYFDVEGDPVVRVLPNANLNPAKVRWVKPKTNVTNPSLSAYTDWDEVAAADAVDDTKDQSLDYFPFKCDRLARKCTAYVRPEPNQNSVTMGGVFQVNYDLWVDVDPATNADPSYSNLSGAARFRKSRVSGRLSVDFKPVNDSPVVPDILQTTWNEDQSSQPVIKLLPNLGSNAKCNEPPSTPIANLLVNAQDAKYCDYDDGDAARDAGDIEVRYSVQESGNTVLKTSYCQSPEEIADPIAFPRTAADFPGALSSAGGINCTVQAGEVGYIAVPDMGALATSVLYNLPTETLTPVTIQWKCAPDAFGCQGKVQVPPNYFGTFSFDYRIRTSEADNSTIPATKNYRSEDWSAWKNASITIQPVPDKPIATGVNMDALDSKNNAIKEDSLFEIILARANGNDASTFSATDLGPTGAVWGATKRIYNSYFDVDKTDDIAKKIIVTSISSSTAGLKVMRDVGGTDFDLSTVVTLPDGSTVTGNDSIFTCDNYGLCTASVTTGNDVNTRSGGDPNFGYIVLSGPKNTTTHPMAIHGLASEPATVSFKIASSDDAPTTGGLGSGDLENLLEDEPNIVPVKLNPTLLQLGYSDKDPGDFAEKIEVADVTFVDTVPTLSFGSDGYGWPAPVPAALTRVFPNNKPWVLGDRRSSPTDVNTSYSTVAPYSAATAGSLYLDALATTPNPTFFRPSAVVNSVTLPDRWVFSCRRKKEGDLPTDLKQGDCKLLVFGPKDFNTRDESNRTLKFKWRVFTRWENDSKSWDWDDESNGSWTPWTENNVDLAPVNDTPQLAANFDNSKISSEPAPLGTAFPGGNNTATNRVFVKEDQFTSINFGFRDTYDSVESNTETYTYQRNRSDAFCPAEPGVLPTPYLVPYFCAEFFKEWLGQKLSVYNLDLKSYFYDNPQGRLAKFDTDEVIINPELITTLTTWNGSAFVAGATPGQYWGTPAPQTSTTNATNINCSTNGNCTLKFQPPPDFYGIGEIEMKMADGKPLPEPGDWTPGSKKVYFNVKNSDDSPTAYPFVLDLMEGSKQTLSMGRIVPNTGLCLGGARGDYGTFFDIAGTVGGEYGRMSFTQPKENTNTPKPWFFGIDKVIDAAQKYAGCQVNVIHPWISSTFIRMYTMSDPDREVPIETQFRNVTNLAVNDWGTSNGIDGMVNSLKQPRRQELEIPYGASSVDSVNFGASGQPFIYKDTGSVFSSGTLAQKRAFGPDGFEYRVRTKNTEECQDPIDTNIRPDECWSNWAKATTRIHPVNQNLVVNPAYPTPADTLLGKNKFNCTSTLNPPANGGTGGEFAPPSSFECFEEINVIEDTKFTITVKPSWYTDPDITQHGGRDAKYARAIGIRQCARENDEVPQGSPPSMPGIGFNPKLIGGGLDNKYFSWGPSFSHQSEYEDNIANGRLDELINPDSFLKQMKRSKGTLKLNGASFQRNLWQKSAVSAGLGDNIASSNSIPTPAGAVTLSSSCGVDGSWTNGTCSIDLLPPPNSSNISAVVCVQVNDGVGPGEFFANTPRRDQDGQTETDLLNRTGRFYIKINISPKADMPKISLLPARGRANEDNAAEFSIGPWDTKPVPFSASFGNSGNYGESLSGASVMQRETLLANAAGVYKPGYFDHDGDKASHLMIETKVSTGYTGIKGSAILYDQDVNSNSYAYSCIAGNSGGVDPDVCVIPCKADGYCNFKISPQSNLNASFARLKLKYWVKVPKPADGNIVLSTRQQDNLVANIGNGAPYTSYEPNWRYLNSDMQVCPTGGLNLDEWRLANEETGASFSIPGNFYDALYYNSTNPVGEPTYAQKSPPSASRLLPDLAGLGTKNTRFLAISLTGSPLPWASYALGGGATSLASLQAAFSTSYSLSFGGSGGGFILPENNTSNTLSNGAACPRMETGSIVVDFSTVPDKPITGAITRTFLEGSSGNLLYVGTSASDGTQDGISDGDSDAPNKLFFLDSSQLPSSVGTLSMSATPPGSPLGMDLPTAVGGPMNGKKFLGSAANATAAGCQLASSRCLVYFHPAPFFNGSVILDYAVETGTDAWLSDTAGVGVGKLTITVADVNDSPTLTWVDPKPVTVNGGSVDQITTHRFTPSEGGASTESSQALFISVTSSDTSLLTASIRNAANSGNWTDPGVANSANGLLRLTAKPFASGTATITITMTDDGTPSQTTTEVFNVTVVNPNAKPTILSNEGVGPFVITEDISNQVIKTNLGVDATFSVDEGAGDTDDQQVSVTFTSSDILLIPNNNITFSRTDSAGTFNMGALAGNVVITPASNAATTTTPVTITMTVTELNTIPAKFETFSFGVNISALDDPPTVSANLLNNSPYNSGVEDTALSINSITIDEGGGLDENPQNVSITFLAGYDTDLIASLGFNRADAVNLNLGAAPGSIIVTPKANAFGSTSITMRVSDGTNFIDQNFSVAFASVNDAPRITSTAPGAQTINEDNPLIITNITIDEGGATSGFGNEDSESLTFQLISSNQALVPDTQVVLNSNSDDSSTDSNSVNRTLTVTPLADKNGTTTITLKASDGTNNNVTIASFLLTVTAVPDLPAGSVTCSPSSTPGQATGTFVVKSGVNTSLKNISCSGITDPDGTAVSYFGAGSCNPTLSVNSTTAAISGIMPGADCTLEVLATSAGDTILSGQKAILEFKEGGITSATLGVASFSDESQCLVQATASASYSGLSIYTSATATTTPSWFINTSGTASATSWNGKIENFDNTSVTLNWNVSSTGSDSLTATRSVVITTTDLPTLLARSPLATLAGNTQAGQQPDFVQPSATCLNTTQCLASPRVSVAASADGTCAIDINGSLSCQGDNNSVGKLGLNSVSTSPRSTVAGSATNVRAISLGKEHGCYVNAANEVYCWGQNSEGQLGMADTIVRVVPTKIPSISNAVAVAAGAYHTCVLLSNETVTCFGRNAVGQLAKGNTSASGQSTPAAVASLTDVKAIASGSGHTCAFTDNGTTKDVKCWGSNSTDQLGVSGATSTTPVSTTALVSGDLANVIGVFAGGSESAGTYTGNTCVLLSTGAAHCWGNNANGELGTGVGAGTLANTSGTTALPVRVDASNVLGTPGAKIVTLSVGASHSCAIKSNKTMWCWGNNSSGQLGLGNTTNQLYATEMTTHNDVLALGTGSAHTCYVRTLGLMHCMGQQNLGRLGNNLLVSATVTTPVQSERQSDLLPFVAGYQRCMSAVVNP